jgi:alpha-tubulin suppressor-like RCC1 family protein
MVVAACFGSAASAWALGGEVMAVGHDGQGELGIGFESGTENVAAAMPGLQHVVQISVGFNFGLAIVKEGEGPTETRVMTWGENNKGQLGLGEGVSKEEVATEIKSLAGATEVVAAGTHAMALKGGKVYTWGERILGTSGNGIPNAEEKERESKEKWLPKAAWEPEEVTSLSGVQRIAAGGPTDYAVLSTGEVVAWGENLYGQTGPNVKEQPSSCNEVTHTKKQEQLKCLCQSENTLTVSVPCTTLPVVISTGLAPVKNIVGITAGEQSAYAETSSGGLDSWGTNVTGELGTKAEFKKYNPYARAVSLPSGELEEVAPGSHHVLARISKKVYGWGNNASGVNPKTGQHEVYNDLLGEELVGGEWQHRESSPKLEECGSKTYCYNSPVELPLSAYGSISAIGAGKADSFIVTESGGKVYGWGNGEFGRLGVSQWPFTAENEEQAKEEGAKFPELIVSEPRPVLGTESNPEHSVPVENVQSVEGSEQRSAFVLREGVTATPQHPFSVHWESMLFGDLLTVNWAYKWPNEPHTSVAYKVRACEVSGPCKTEEVSSETQSVSFLVAPKRKYEVVLKWGKNNRPSERNKQLKELESP